MRLQEIGKEKQLENHEDDEQFDENDDPKRLAKRHRSESIVIQMKHFIEKAVLSHANCSKLMWQIYIFYPYYPNY